MNIVQVLNRFKWLLLFVLVSTVAIVALYRASFIKISLPSPTTSDIIIRLTTADGSSKELTIESGSSSLSKLVFGSEYEVWASTTDTSSVHYVDTARFARTTEVALDMRPEADRVFVGDNPSTCTYYDDTLLHSYPCQSSLSSLVTHEASIGQQAGYTSSYNGPNPDLKIVDTVTINNVSTGLFEDPDGNIYLSTLSGGRPGELRVLEGLSSTNYRLVAYGDRLLLYSADHQDLLIFDSLDKSPSSIILEPYNDLSLIPGPIRASANQIVALYPSGLDIVATGDGDSPLIESSGNSGITIFKDGLSTKHNLSLNIEEAMPCGDNICVLTATKNLRIYRQEASSLELLSSFTPIQSMLDNQGSILVSTAQDIIELDYSGQSGRVAYGSGSYRLCGMSTAGGSQFIACVINKSNKRQALLIDTAKESLIPIDSYIESIVSNGLVDAVNVHGNNLLIYPIKGDYRVDPKSGLYGIDRSALESTRSGIKDLVESLGIGQPYSILIL